MNLQDLVALIEKHNLSIRRIPMAVHSLYEARHFKPGDEIIFMEKYGRDMCRHTTVPVHAGKWMCRSVSNTSSSVVWNIKTDNLADTLEQSIEMFLVKLSKEENA